MENKMAPEVPIHILLVSFPAQGHVNPLIRLGKHLASKGCFVTFSTAENFRKQMQVTNTINKTSSPTPIANGFLNFDFFHDGLGDDDPKRHSLSEYIAQLQLVGNQVVSQMIKKHAEQNRPVSCIINNPFLPWVCDVATEHAIPCALYWIHSAATYTACYHYFKKLSLFPTPTEPYIDVQLPGIVLKHNEIPDFLHPFTPVPLLKTLVMQQFENLSKTLCVLMDTFEELEHGYINYLSKFHPIRPVGPLFMSPVGLSTKNVSGDLVKANDDCINWLNSRPPASVVYVSLGTIVSLSVEQVGEFAYALLNSQVSFLWVLRPSEREEAIKSNVLPNGFFERTSERGKVVEWTPQEEVLAHPSVACYLSHCGWNSTVEALASGVPMLTFSQWGDQVTNAKFIVDVYGIGIRVGHNLSEKKIITRDEMKRFFLEATVGPKAEELKKNALKWKNAAEAARAHGGFSDRNLDAFVEDVKKLVTLK